MGSLGFRRGESVVTQVSVGGFDEKVSAMELAEFLEHEVGLVWRCRLKTLATPPESYPDFSSAAIADTGTAAALWKEDYEKVAPHAFVHFVVSDGAARAIRVADERGLVLNGRSLMVRSVADSGLLFRRRRTADPFKFPAAGLKMGTLAGTHELWFAWEGPDSGVDFVVDPFDARCRLLFPKDVVFSLKGKREKAMLRCDLKLEFSVREMEEVRFYSDSSSIVVFLRLACSPLVFYRTADDDVFCSEPVNLLDDDDPWIRTTDFTLGGAAGRCGCYRLSFSPRYGAKLKKAAAYLTEQGVTVRDLDWQLAVRREPSSVGSAAPSSELFFSVPPVAGVGFGIMFLVNALVHKGILNQHRLSEDFFALLRTDDDDDGAAAALTEAALKRLCSSKQPVFDSAERLKLVRDWLRRNPKLRRSPQGAGETVEMRRLVITPTRAYCLPPELELSNRVLRHYSAVADRFLRVTFTDEGMRRLSSGVLTYYPAAIVGDLTRKFSPQKTAIFKRLRTILTEGFSICGRTYSFLAFSSNQLRDRSAWFFAGDGEHSVLSIRSWMGRFPDRNVAKFAARMGQCFSSTYATVAVPPAEVDPCFEEIEGNGYVFSDGIGKVSPELAMEVAQKLQLAEDPPSAYQIRYGGCKGVIAVWPAGGAAGEYRLSLRPSMRKFESSHAVIEVASWTKFQPGFLNREIVTLLSCLGVTDQVFDEMQAAMVRRLDEMLVDPAAAMELLTSSSGEQGTLAAVMLGAGFRPQTEPHLKAMLSCVRSAQLRDLLRKTRIFVPRGRWLMGCLDELGVLEHGQCFIQSSSPSLEKFFSRHGRRFSGAAAAAPRRVITGTVAVAKNPCLHPGDIRVLEAVDAPGLRHLVDCLVFPQKGERPHCNEASGSDLDGDLYFVTWDNDLVPPARRSWSPMDYTPAKVKIHPCKVSSQDIVDFFLKSMVNENLGQICHAHVVHADRSPVGAMDEKCLQLAELAAQAVDFPKTGKVVTMPRELRPKLYPDFMEKPHHLSYCSEKILGILYRKMRSFLDREDNPSSLAGEEGGAATAAAMPTYDGDLAVDGAAALLPEAWSAKRSYDAQLNALLGQYGVAHEGELATGHIWSLPRAADNRRERESKERLKSAYSELRREFRRVFEDLGSAAAAAAAAAAEVAGAGEDDAGRLYEVKASAWYQVAYHPEWVEKARQMREPGAAAALRLSFPWIAADYLARIKVRRRRDRGELDGNQTEKPVDALAAYLRDKL
ncbi:unnamed protein product [Spirodela intermedia]|uniref:RNA-dependent RNA polymerase n=1 Tax=Spirodela intermedia TaxID=51605 RepID=A0A7I8KQL2_SPIIN|nr:unnamed protein product [Spirodela intermedia]